MSFLTAGYETTAQALAFAAYHIATDEQGVQVKKNQFDTFDHLCYFLKQYRSDCWRRSIRWKEI